MKLFLDTETTGVIDWNKPLGDIRQPRPVSVALILTDDLGEIKETFYELVNYGVEIPQEAINIHGITNEMVKGMGIQPKELEAVFNKFSIGCNELIGHNIKFDKTILMCAGIFPAMFTFCTMLQATAICKLPKAKGNGYKWPKLTEAYKILCGKELIGAHNALEDTKACVEVYKALKSGPQSSGEKKVMVGV